MHTITTETHDITAYYQMDDYAEGYALDTNGDTLKDITTDLLNFANEWDETAETFEISSEQDRHETHGDYIITLDGVVYEDDTKTDTMNITIIITAEEK